jgi:predicted nucleic acid-binding protein
MLVVADSSPFIGLFHIERMDILPLLYGSVIIPKEVARELAMHNKPPAVQVFIQSPPSWLSIRIPTHIEPIPNLDKGERDAISLARELSADLLLIDERAGREAAIARNIRTLRTTALLLVAANAGVLTDLKAAFNKLKTTNFRVPAQVLDDLLEQHELFKNAVKSPSLRNNP